jgi:hypothetical protein
MVVEGVVWGMVMEPENSGGEVLLHVAIEKVQNLTVAIAIEFTSKKDVGVAQYVVVLSS